MLRWDQSWRTQNALAPSDNNDARLIGLAKDPGANSFQACDLEVRRAQHQPTAGRQRRRQTRQNGRSRVRNKAAQDVATEDQVEYPRWRDRIEEIVGAKLDEPTHLGGEPQSALGGHW